MARLGFKNIMVDTETTGDKIWSGKVGIIELAAREFCLETGQVGDSFIMSVLPEEWAEWDPRTVEHFWKPKGSVLPDILSRALPAREVFTAYVDWVGYCRGSIFWSRPISFDFPLIEQHLFKLDLVNPFNYWESIDTYTFIRAMRRDSQPWKLHQEIPFVGVKHTALDDVDHHIKIVMEAMKRTAPDEPSETLPVSA